MATTIAFTNQKGGVGKTTSAVNISAALAMNGSRVLLVDMDYQGHATISSGIDLNDGDVTIYEALKGTGKAANAVRHSAGGYDVLPADTLLSAAEVELIHIAGGEYILDEVLEQFQDQYEYILIDCNPNLSLITNMSITAADYVIIPVVPEYLPLDGVANLMETMNLIKKRMNPKLETLGFLITMDGRTRLNRDSREAVDAAFPGKRFSATISRATPLAEAPAVGESIFQYAPKSKSADQYRELTNEIIERIKNHG